MKNIFSRKTKLQSLFEFSQLSSRAESRDNVAEATRGVGFSFPQTKVWGYNKSQNEKWVPAFAGMTMSGISRYNFFSPLFTRDITMKHLLSLATIIFSFLIFHSSFLIAQVPAITNFSPRSGAVGSSVTITGTNFNATSANNIVYFGGVKASVTGGDSSSLTVAVPTGATYKPITVLSNRLSANSTLPFVVTFDELQSVSTKSFGAKVDITANRRPWRPALADMDGDSKPDLVVINDSDNTVSVFRNISTPGSFSNSTFSAPVDFATGTSPWAMDIADIDGDGKLDIIVANTGGGTISILRNTSSTGSITAGSFETKVDITSGGDVYDVTVADLDVDGKPDIVVATWWTVTVFRNTSSGDSIGMAAKIDFNVSNGAVGVVVGDIDGNGKPEVAATQYVGNTVLVYQNVSTPGSFTGSSLSSPVSFAVGSYPRILTIGDLDGDDKLDLAVPNENAGTVSVLRNTSSTGSITSGSFASKVDFAAGGTARSASINDLDGDGKPELMVVNSTGNSISVLRNTSTSGSILFDSKFDLATGVAPWSAAIGDIDGDGRTDMAISNTTSKTVSLFKNLNGVTAIFPAQNALNVSPSTDISVTFNTDIDDSSLSSSSFVVTGSVSGKHYGSFSIGGGEKAGTTISFNPTNDFKNGEIVTVDVTSGVFDATYTSIMPFVSQFTISSVASSGTFATKVDYATGSQPASVFVSDVDGDGDNDLAVANGSSNTVSILMNNGNGTFAAKVDYTTGSVPQSVFISDVDGDGDGDLAVANFSSNSVSVLKNNGNGTFAAKADYTTGSVPNSVFISDVDGDGDGDLVVANYSSSTVSILKNNGNGTFAAKVDYTTGTNPNSVYVSDVDGDGDGDLAATNENDWTVSILKNNGNGTFAAKVDYPTGTLPVSVFISDVDGDGDGDLAIANRSASTVSILKNNGDGTFIAKEDYTSGSLPVSVFINDVDGDGDGDFAVVNKGDYTVSILRNNGNGTFAAKADFAVGIFPTSVFVSDVDGDGDGDIAVANGGSDTVSVLKNINNGVIVVTPPPDSTIHWNDSTMWSGGHIPTAADSIVIPPNFTIVLNTDSLHPGNQTLGTLILSDSSTIQVSGSGAINFLGNFTINGSFLIDTVSVPTMNVGGNFLVNGTFNPGRSHIVIVGTTQQIVGSGGGPGKFASSTTTKFYDITNTNSLMETQGKIVVQNSLEVDAAFTVSENGGIPDTIVIENDEPTSVRGSGTIRNGAMRRRVKGQTGKTAVAYQFHSPNTSIEIDTIGNNPEYVTIAKFPTLSADTSRYFAFKGGTVDTQNNYIRLGNITSYSKWVFGQVGHKLGDSTVGPLYEITTEAAGTEKSGTALPTYSPVTVSLNYDPTALKGIPEDSLGIMKSARALKVKVLVDVDKNPATTIDRVAKDWNIKIYSGSLDTNNIIATTNESELLIEEIGSGVFIAEQFDSAEWRPMQQYRNGTSVSLDSHRVYVSLSQEKLDSITFVNYFTPDTAYFRTFAAYTELSEKGKKIKFKKGVLKEQPNMATAVEGVFKKLGKSGGTFLGVAQPVKDSAKKYAWIAYKKASSLGRLFIGVHSGRSYPLDSLRYFQFGKKNRKFNKNIQPDARVNNNVIWEQGVLLELNIQASNYGITPVGFGDLLLDTSFVLMNRQLKRQPLKRVKGYLDTLLTYWERNGVTNNDAYENLDDLAKFLRRIHLGFYAPLDSTNYLISAEEVAATKNPFAIRLQGTFTAADVKFVRYSRDKTSSDVLPSPVFIPETYSLNQNYPNPFNPLTTVGFQMADDGLVSLKIYDVLGREVKTLLNNEEFEGGEHEVEFDANTLSSGVYFYRMNVLYDGGYFTAVKKIVLMK